LEARWQAFKERIPNKDFKAGLERAEAMAPNSIRAKMMGEAMTFYNDSYKSDGSKVAQAPGAPQELAAATTLAPAAKAAPTAAVVIPTPGAAPTAEATASGDRTIASLAAPDKEGVYPRTMGMYIGISQNEDALNSLVQGANGAGEGETIFKAVSLRYRKLMPMLLGKLNRDAR
jgi:hypothetical protein